MNSPSASSDPLLLQAAARRPVARPPVWFMRQAGRSLPEYRALRATTSMLEACRTPSLVAEITMQPVRRHHVDAAIFFSDIVVPMQAAGVGVEIVAGVGPVIDQPVRTHEDVQRLRQLTPDALEDIAESVRLTVAELGDTPLIGFAGAPFTLASYLVEGGPSKNHQATKAMMYGNPGLWHQLCTVLAQWSATFLRVQINAGARAIQLFDSWVGAVPVRDYTALVQEHSAWVFDAVADTGVPRIHFGVGTGELLGAMGECGAEVVGVDYRLSLTAGSQRVGGSKAVQGNLDPAILGAPWEVVEQHVRRIVTEGRACPGHIFNLGHGVLPETDPDVLTRVVELIHSLETDARA